MPNRILRDWTDSEKVNSVSAYGERLLTRLLQKADDYGRFTANPKLVRSLLFPLLIDSIREADVSRWIAECEDAGLIALYTSKGKRLLVIRNFGQRLRTPPPVPKYDAPPDGLLDDPPQVAASRGEFPPYSETETETHSETKPSASCSEPLSRPELEAIYPVFPTKGKEKRWRFSPAELASLQSAFPDLDIEQQSRRAHGWCVANPTRQKTAKGMHKFLFGWMERAQNRGVGIKGGSAKPAEDEFQLSFRDPTAAEVDEVLK